MKRPIVIEFASEPNFGSDAISMIVGQVAPISLACRRSSLPRPYICRLTSLSLVICPSIGRLTRAR